MKDRKARRICVNLTIREDDVALKAIVDDLRDRNKLASTICDLLRASAQGSGGVVAQAETVVRTIGASPRPVVKTMRTEIARPTFED